MFCLLVKHKEFIFEVFSVLKLFECFCICRSFQIWVRLWKTSQKTLGKISEDSWKILGRLLEDFARIFPMKSLGSLPKSYAQSGNKGMMSSEVQDYLCWGTISSSMCNSFVYGLLYDLYVYYFNCKFFCKLEEMLNKKKCGIYAHVFF